MQEDEKNNSKGLFAEAIMLVCLKLAERAGWCNRTF